MSNPRGAAVLSPDIAIDEHDERVVAIGHKVIWKARSVEVTDLVTLDPGWCQVLVCFTDDPNRPPVSMPYDELVAGLAR